MNTSNQDVTLIQWLESSDKILQTKSLKELYSTHYPTVSKLIKSMRGTDDDARDIFQEALITLNSRITTKTFILNGTLGGFLFHTSRLLWLRILSKKKGVKFEDEIPTTYSDENFSAQENLEELERDKALQQLLAHGEDDCKKILSFVYYEKLLYRDIYLKMGYASENVARNKKKICLDKLKNVIFQNPSLKQLFYAVD